MLFSLVVACLTTLSLCALFSPQVLWIPTGMVASKLFVGDWDEGYQWTWMDVVYWISLFSVSAGAYAAAVRFKQ